MSDLDLLSQVTVAATSNQTQILWREETGLSKHKDVSGQRSQLDLNWKDQ